MKNLMVLLLLVSSVTLGVNASEKSVRLEKLAKKQARLTKKLSSAESELLKNQIKEELAAIESQIQFLNK